MIPFAVFWIVALVSNTAAAAQAVAVGWALGDLTLPAGILLVRQVAGAVGAIVGVMVGTALIPRIGFRRCLIASSVGEAAAALAVAVAAGGTSGSLSTGQATAVAVAGGLMTFAGAVGSPAWLALVAGWPGTADRTRQLLLDSVQFQLGRSIGPLVGAVLLSLTFFAVQISSVANAVSFLLVALALGLRGRVPVAQGVSDRPAQPSLRSLVPSLRSPVVLALIVMAVCADAGRTFLPRIMQAAGADSAVYSVSASVGAVAAAGAAYVATRRRLGERTLATTGMVLLTAAMACWAAAPLWWPLWIVGSGILGAGVSVSASALVSALMRTKGDLHGVSVATLTRTFFSVAGGLAFTTVLGVTGAFTFLVFVPVAAVSTLLLGRTTAFDGPAPEPHDGGGPAHGGPSGGG